LVLKTLLQSKAKNLGTVALQQIVQPIDVIKPLSRPTMHDLGEVEESRLSQLEQLLALQIAFSALARYRGHHSGTMFGERGAFLGHEFPWMQRFKATRDDAYAVCVQVQRPGILMASGGIE
jgi:hypothetical protein